jgi:hypothetical protein
MVAVAPAQRPPSRSTVAEAAQALRRILASIEEGELSAATPQEVALVRRLQGAVVAMEAVSGPRVPTSPESGVE